MEIGRSFNRRINDRSGKMSIQSSEITENSIQSDGTRYVSFRYTFTNGDIITFGSMQKPSDYDVDAGLIAYATEAETVIVEREDSELTSLIDAGTDPMDIEPVHPTTDTAAARKRRFRRKLLRLIATEGDLKEIRRILYPIWYWLKFESGYTAQQIANYLGISLTVLQRINNRFQALHDNLAFVDSDDDHIGEVD